MIESTLTIGDVPVVDMHRSDVALDLWSVSTVDGRQRLLSTEELVDAIREDESRWTFGDKLALASLTAFSAMVGSSLYFLGGGQ